MQVTAEFRAKFSKNPPCIAGEGASPEQRLGRPLLRPRIPQRDDVHLLGGRASRRRIISITTRATGFSPLLDLHGAQEVVGFSTPLSLGISSSDSNPPTLTDSTPLPVKSSPALLSFATYAAQRTAPALNGQARRTCLATPATQVERRIILRGYVNCVPRPRRRGISPPTSNRRRCGELDRRVPLRLWPSSRLARHSHLATPSNRICYDRINH